MDAVANKLPRTLAAAVLGLLTFALLARLGVITVTGLLSVASIGLLMLVFGAAALSPLFSAASSEIHAIPSGTSFARADLARWIRGRAAQGSLVGSAGVLARRASRALHRRVTQGELCAALERFDADRVVATAQMGGVR